MLRSVEQHVRAVGTSALILIVLVLGGVGVALARSHAVVLRRARDT